MNRVSAKFTREKKEIKSKLGLCLKQVPRRLYRMDCQNRQGGRGFLSTPPMEPQWDTELSFCSRFCPLKGSMKGLPPSRSGSHGNIMAQNSKILGTYCLSSWFCLLIFVWGPAKLNNFSHHVL